MISTNSSENSYSLGMISKSFSSYFLNSSCLPFKSEPNVFESYTLNRQAPRVIMKINTDCGRPVRKIVTIKYLQNAVAVPTIRGVNMIAPISANNPGLVKAQVSHGVRQVRLVSSGIWKILHFWRHFSKQFFHNLAILPSNPKSKYIYVNAKILSTLLHKIVRHKKDEDRQI